MKTQEIRKMIENAIKEEKQTGRLAEAVRALANQNGMKPSAEQVSSIVEFVRSYIELVPLYIEQGVAAAGRVGLGAEMGRMVGELEVYWLEPNDVIPDNLGLLGLMDDAYASLFLLQGVSDYCKASAGRPLLGHDLTAANLAIRQLLGVQVAALLETRVGITIGQAMMQRVLTQFAASAPFSFGGGPHPIWGNASIDEIVDARLGAMGIVR